MEKKPYNLLLDNDFDKLEELARLAAEAAKAPTFSESDMDQAREDAYMRGKNDGLRDALNNQEERIALCLEKLTTRFDDLISRQAVYETVQQKESIFIAVNILRKIMPEFIAEKGKGEIKALLEKALKNNSKETELLIKVHPSVFRDIQTLIDTIAAENGYKRISVKEDSALDRSDCIIEWGNGGIARIVPVLWDEIETQIKSFLKGESIEDYLQAPIQIEEKNDKKDDPPTQPLIETEGIDESKEKGEEHNE